MTRFMIKRMAPILMLAFVVLSTGCLKMEHDLRIKEDGTATYRLKYAISEQAIVQLRAMEKLKKDLALAGGEPPPGIEMDPLLHLFLDPDDGELREADITSGKGDTCRVRVATTAECLINAGSVEPTRSAGNVLEFPTRAGDTYRLSVRR